MVTERVSGLWGWGTAFGSAVGGCPLQPSRALPGWGSRPAEEVLGSTIIRPSFEPHPGVAADTACPCCKGSWPAAALRGVLDLLEPVEFQLWCGERLLRVGEEPWNTARLCWGRGKVSVGGLDVCAQGPPCTTVHWPYGTLSLALCTQWDPWPLLAPPPPTTALCTALGWCVSQSVPVQVYSLGNTCIREDMSLLKGQRCG